VVVLLVAACFLASVAGSAGAKGGKEYPRRAVAVTVGGRVVVLDARDGRRVRTLSARASRYGGLAVQRGAVWFLSRGGRSITTCGHGAPPDQHLMSVPLAGGTPRRVLEASVRWFSVSPDGRKLAVTEGQCPPAGTITLYDLATGARTGTWTGTPPDGTSGAVSSLTWSPDSRSLLYVREIGSTSPWILDTTSATSLDDAHRVPIGDGSSVTGYLGASGSLLGVFLTASGTSHVWTIDPVTGARQHRLFCCGRPLSADASGTAVLATTGTRGDELVRWSSGDRAPTRIARGVTGAVWVEPDRP
jgi:WD40 repeat protein